MRRLVQQVVTCSSCTCAAGAYQSTPHRVINSDPARSRVSLPFFYEPAFDAQVLPVSHASSLEGKASFACALPCSGCCSMGCEPGCLLYWAGLGASSHSAHAGVHTVANREGACIMPFLHPLY